MSRKSSAIGDKRSTPTTSSADQQYEDISQPENTLTPRSDESDVEENDDMQKFLQKVLKFAKKSKNFAATKEKKITELLMKVQKYEQKINNLRNLLAENEEVLNLCNRISEIVQ